jgi:hypothetical protein
MIDLDQWIPAPDQATAAAVLTGIDPSITQ